MSVIERFEHMLAKGQDTALLRYGLGNEYLKADAAEKAVEHLREAVRRNPDYSAAWKLYGKALDSAGQSEQATAAFEQGIAVSEKNGDVQAAKEMRVFLTRIRKASGA